MIKVAILYRVIQDWRVPVFERLSRMPGIDLCVFHGDDFPNTKVKNFKGQLEFRSCRVSSWNITLKTSNGNAYTPFSPRLYRELAAFSPDVIISEGASNLLNNTVAWIYAKLHGKAFLQWGLGAIEGRRRSAARKVADLLFRTIELHSEGAIAYSNYGALYYRQVGLPAERIFVAVNVVDTEGRLEEFRRYCQRENRVFPSPPPDRFHVLFVGALSENKQVEKLVDAFVAFANHAPDAHLTIVGDGSARAAIETIISESGKCNQITMAGHVSRDVGRYFYDASIFVLPGLGGLAVSDALVHGVPVICTIGDGCEKDLIVDGENGWRIVDLTKEILVDKLFQLYRDPELVARLRAGAQGFASGRHSIQQYVQTIFQAIQAVRYD